MSDNRTIGNKHQREEDSEDDNSWEDCSRSDDGDEGDQAGDKYATDDEEEPDNGEAPAPPRVIHTTPLLLPVLEMKEIKPKKEKKGKTGAAQQAEGPTTSNAFLSATACATVAERMKHAHYFGYIRSAGRKGYDAWEILVAAGRVPLCVDARSYTKHTAKQVRQGTLSQLVPLGLLTLKKHPASKNTKKKNKTPAMAIIVVHLGPLEERNWLSKFNIRDARRFRFISDPKSNTVSIPCGTQFSQEEDVSIELIGGSNVTTINSGFLEYSSSISDVTINLPQLTAIGDDFCVKCYSLQSIQIPLQNITIIGDQFLAKCLFVHELDFSEMKNVTYIGDRFMVSCSGIEHLNLSGMSKIAYIGHSFLYLCTNLISVDFPQRLAEEVSSITVSDTFMSFCNNLKAVDVTWMGEAFEGSSYEFLLECNELEYVSLAPFSKATEIQRDFLASTTYLKTINLNPLRNVRVIGDRFLFNCGVETIDLEPLGKVEVIGSGFLGADSNGNRSKCDTDRMTRIANMTDAQRSLPGNSIMSCFSQPREPFSTIRCGATDDLRGLNPVVLAALRLSGFNV